MELFNILLVNPITNILVALYQGLVFLHVPSPLGFAVILLTLIIRFILYPITASQLKTSKKMQEIAPHVSALKTKHKDDPKRLQQETMALYAQYGVNPIAGCLPAILQLVVLFGLYGAIGQITHDPKTALSSINSMVYFDWLRLPHIWDTNFFGISLVSHPLQIWQKTPAIVLVPVVTAFLQFIQSSMMFVPQQSVSKAPKSGDTAAEFQASMQNSTTYILPIMIGIFAFNYPIALALYWNTFTIFGIIQQYRLAGLGRIGHWRDQYLAKRSQTKQK